MKTKPKEYKLETVEDLFQMITEENVGRFFKDFPKIVEAWLLFKALAKQKKIKKSEIHSRYLIWIDDGKNDITVKFQNNP